MPTTDSFSQSTSRCRLMLRCSSSPYMVNYNNNTVTKDSLELQCNCYLFYVEQSSWLYHHAVCCHLLHYVRVIVHHFRVFL